MSTIGSLCGIAFAAFCVWATVRIANRPQKRARRVAIALGAIALYILSFGPVCWISSRCDGGTEIIWIAYRPLFEIFQWHGPRVIQNGLRWYAELGVPDDHYLATWDGGFFWQVGLIFD